MKDLWTCPKCGHQFVSANSWHSCGRYDFEHLFLGKDPFVYILFVKFRQMVESCDEVKCYPQKTRIVFQHRMRFASCQVATHYLQCNLNLPKPYPGEKHLMKIEKYGETCYGHSFKMERLSDFDDAFMVLIRESYLVGQQKFIRRRSGNSKQID